MLDPNRLRDQAARRRAATDPPAGQRDLSDARLTYHAIERFIERYHVDEANAEAQLRQALQRIRRLGRNPKNGAVAYLAVHREKALIAIFQEDSCLTVLTWNLFLPRLEEFGRPKLPRNRGRWLKRLTEPVESKASADQ